MLLDGFGPDARATDAHERQTSSAKEVADPHHLTAIARAK